MAVNLTERLKELKKAAGTHDTKKIKLVNGDTLEGRIDQVYEEMFVIEMTKGIAGRPKYTVPFSSILYISDCELS